MRCGPLLTQNTLSLINKFFGEKESGIYKEGDLGRISKIVKPCPRMKDLISY